MALDLFATPAKIRIDFVSTSLAPGPDAVPVLRVLSPPEVREAVREAVHLDLESSLLIHPAQRGLTDQVAFVSCVFESVKGSA